MNKGKKSTENLSLLYQSYTPTVIYKHKYKIGPPYRRQVFHSRPQTPHGDSVTKPGTLLLIILSLVCIFDINEVHGNMSNGIQSWKFVRIIRPSNDRRCFCRCYVSILCTLWNSLEWRWWIASLIYFFEIHLKNVNEIIKVSWNFMISL